MDKLDSTLCASSRTTHSVRTSIGKLAYCKRLLTLNGACTFDCAGGEEAPRLEIGLQYRGQLKSKLTHLFLLQELQAKNNP